MIKLCVNRVIMFLLLINCAALQASEFGIVKDVLVDRLPYYSEQGKNEGVLEDFDNKIFIGLTIQAVAPKGLIQLKVQGESRWFRSIHFDIKDGVKIVCPNVLVGESKGTKRPVSINMEGDCEPSIK